jgi:hypothetical protein
MTTIQTKNAERAGLDTDYNPDEKVLRLAEIQIQHLAELQELAMKVARDVAAASSKEKPADLAMARISKVILQIVMLSQETAALREKTRVDLKHYRKLAKRDAVRNAVDAAMAAAHPERSFKQRNDLMRGIVETYDFSNPRKVAEMVAEICRALGVPFRPEIWPAEEPAAEAAAPAQAAETAEAEGAAPTGAKPAAQPAGPAKTLRIAPRFDRAGVSSAGLMAFAPPVSGGETVNGHDPPPCVARPVGPVLSPSGQRIDNRGFSAGAIRLP